MDLLPEIEAQAELSWDTVDFCTARFLEFDV